MPPIFHFSLFIISSIIMTKVVKLSSQYPFTYYFLVTEISIVEIFMIKINTPSIRLGSGYGDRCKTSCEFFSYNFRRKRACHTFFFSFCLQKNYNGKSWSCHLGPWDESCILSTQSNKIERNYVSIVC